VRLANLPKDEQAIYDFADEFLRTHTVSDATLNVARNVLGGDRGIVDLVGTMGLSQISSMMVAGQDAAAAGREAVFSVAAYRSAFRRTCRRGSRLDIVYIRHCPSFVPAARLQSHQRERRHPSHPDDVTRSSASFFRFDTVAVNASAEIDQFRARYHVPYRCSRP
jgi:hypothetical protein